MPLIDDKLLLDLPTLRDKLRCVRPGTMPDELFVLRLVWWPGVLFCLAGAAFIPVLARYLHISTELSLLAVAGWLFAVIPLFSTMDYVFCYDRLELRLQWMSPKRRYTRDEIGSGHAHMPRALRRCPRYRIRRLHTNGGRVFALELEGCRPERHPKFWVQVLRNPGRMRLLCVPAQEYRQVRRLLGAFVSGLNLRPDNISAAEGFSL